MKNWINAWIVPGAVFQSVIVGGGYGTGREVVEFISGYGPLGGLAAVLLVWLLMSLVLAVTFDVARKYKIQDYRTFFKTLLGPFWFVYEIIFLLGLVLVLSVIGSAAGFVLEDRFGLSPAVGIVIMLAMVVAFNYLGRQLVEKTLTTWGLLMSLVLIIYAIATFVTKGNIIEATFSQSSMVPGWWLSGIKFFLYNVILAPVILYAAESIETRHQAWGAGLIAGFLGVLPAAIFHLTFMAGFPLILDEALPTYWMLEQLGFPVLLTVYVVILFGTIVQTGVGVLQGINERLDFWWQERYGQKLQPEIHASLAGIVVLLSLLLANVGIVALIAKGYGAMAWLSLCVYVLPVFTIGAWKLRNKS